MASNVCYWPNLGHCRFGAKVQMGGSMRFDHEGRFDPKRIRLADVDGSGTTDIVYLHPDGVRFYANNAGNTLAAPVILPRLPDVSDLAAVEVIDLLGSGTGCLVWASSLPGARPRGRYIDLLGSKKPHLLTSIANNLGRTTTVTYAPSTKFYLADRAAGRPWVTKLPFVIHVIERVEVFDAISRHRFVTTYAYHHGDYDGVEREMRGFGMVEQRDTESFSAFSGAGFAPPAANADPELHLPPVLTKTWFHTGAWIEGAKISARYESEYYAGDAEAVRLADTLLREDLGAVEMREACRALKGRPLRQEIYALDGSAEEPRPYVVTEHSYAMRRLQPAVGDAHAVFFAHAREALEYHYERSESDPRVTHALTLKVDDYGVVMQAAQIGYRRRAAVTVFPEQEQGKATLTENKVKHLVPDEEGAYRIGVPTETRTYELHGLPLGAEGVLGFQAVFDAAAAAEDVPTLAYEGTPSGGFQKRLLQHARTTYWSDDLTGPLPFGEVGSRALPYESFAKILTPSLITSVFGTRVTSGVLAEGGYLQLPDDPDYWVSSGRAVPSAAHFYLPTTFVDPFGNASQVAYDPYCLLVTAVTDPLSNVVEAVPDYRVLAPRQLTDANGNVSEVRFDALGRVTAMALMGKPGAGEGDTLDDPTATFAYDLERFESTGKPNMVHARAREQHGPGNPRWLDTYSYSDGSGNEVLRKVKAEPGLAPERDANGALVHDAQGNLVFSHATSRWVGTGRTVLDNKGNSVKQYEPFFSATHEYEDETELVELGGHAGSAVRSARPAHPDRSAERHVLAGGVRCVEADVARSERHGAGKLMARGAAGAAPRRPGAPCGGSGRGACRDAGGEPPGRAGAGVSRGGGQRRRGGVHHAEHAGYRGAAARDHGRARQRGDAASLWAGRATAVPEQQRQRRAVDAGGRDRTAAAGVERARVRLPLVVRWAAPVDARAGAARLGRRAAGTALCPRRSAPAGDGAEPARRAVPCV
ncbi:toxin TcdB middle/C-terminal domain-containing protein [Sorangium sp. So ce693]|uniref:toxin TcdB middle/C-terminal domain-containing protein n=1 Tax=Sorangium sp. So ce693 TaxID=3133318 RepID=UPI003F60B0D4